MSERNPHLTPEMAAILRKMKADRDDPDGYEGHLVNDKRSWVVGIDKVPGPAALALLQICAIRQCDFGAGAQYYEIGSEGEHLLNDPAYVPSIVAVRQRGARAVIVDPDGTQHFEY